MDADFPAAYRWRGARHKAGALLAALVSIALSAPRR
jgi:hypothetical protein